MPGRVQILAACGTHPFISVSLLDRPGEGIAFCTRLMASW
jgi:hypothetical protein